VSRTAGGVGGPAASLPEALLAICRRPAAPIDDATFDRLALAVFQWQFERNAPFAAYCRRRGRTPGSVTRWTDVPAVPTAAFKEVALVSGSIAAAQACFRTSGTTRGREARGTRWMLDLAMYHAASLSFFRHCVLPDDAELPFLSLMPPARELPDSSLAHMIDLLCERVGAAGTAGYASAASGLDTDALIERLRAAEARGTAVCLLGTSLAFLHLLDALAARGLRIRLPARSRLMDTGGYKGSDRTVSPDALRASYGERLGMLPSHCVNEYGMTELCSQLYDAALRDEVLHGQPGAPRKIGPPWMRSRVVDPVTLAPLPAGETGILQHCDLANLDAVSFVQTEDLARAVEDGIELLGRDPTATPRGCSIAMDELLQAVRKES
jgi:hypothetical protein